MQRRNGHFYSTETGCFSSALDGHFCPTLTRLYNKIANYSTEESINYLLNILFSCVFARNYERNLQYRLESSRVLEGERSAPSSDRPSEDDARG